MNKVIYSLFILLLMACTSAPVTKTTTSSKSGEFDASSFTTRYDYTLDLNDRSGDSFKVTLKVSDLKAENNVFNLVKTIRGSYGIMDFGRFVDTMIVKDVNGNIVPTTHISQNQWQFSDPTRVSTIMYEIRDTWDFEVDTNEVSLMGGTSLEDDHALVNTHGVFGYISGLQKQGIRLTLTYPQDWKIGTSQRKKSENSYYFSTYDELADSPIMLGRMSEDHFNVGSTKVHVYTYSKTDVLKSADFRDIIKKIIAEQHAFTERAMAEDYTFLFHFEDKHYGALEHIKSSVYTFKEDTYDEVYDMMRDVISHEYYHLQTPLRVRGENIHDFDWSDAVPTKYLWLYEGVTEWASNAVMFRSGITDFPVYFKNLSEKISRMASYDQVMSMTELSLSSYSKPDEYINVYAKGEIVALLLDIHLLDNTDGRLGLRELMVNLAKKYSLEKPFSDENFKEDFIAMSHPSVREFYDKYIDGNDPLPLNEYFSKLGYEFMEERAHPRGLSDFGFGVFVRNDNGKFVIQNIRKSMQDSGIKSNDELIKINGQVVNDETARAIFEEIKVYTETVGVDYTITIVRDDQEMEFNLKTVPYMIQNVFVQTFRPEDLDKKFMPWFTKDAE